MMQMVYLLVEEKLLAALVAKWRDVNQLKKNLPLVHLL